MNYNDGMVHTDFYDNANKDELLERAKDYSEGDQNLYNALLTLWENGIKTFACCKGHDAINKPYIGIIISNDYNNFNFIQNVCDEASNIEGIEITFHNRENDNSLEIHFINEEVKTAFLNRIPDLISRKREHPNDYFLCTMYLKPIANASNVVYDLIINKEEIYLGFHKKDTNLRYNNILNLPNLIETIESTKFIPINSAFKCDKNSIKRLINIFYPNKFKIEDEIKRE